MSVHSDIMQDVGYPVLQDIAADADVVQVSDGQTWYSMTGIVGAITVDDTLSTFAESEEEEKVETRDVVIWREQGDGNKYTPRLKAQVNCGDGALWSVARISGVTDTMMTLHVERKHVMTRRRAGYERR